MKPLNRSIHIFFLAARSTCSVVQCNQWDLFSHGTHLLCPLTLRVSHRRTHTASDRAPRPEGKCGDRGGGGWGVGERRNRHDKNSHEPFAANDPNGNDNCESNGTICALSSLAPAQPQTANNAHKEAQRSENKTKKSTRNYSECCTQLSNRKTRWRILRTFET